MTRGIAIVGNPAYGPVKMRGRALAAAAGLPLFRGLPGTVSVPAARRPYDTILAIKRVDPRLRECCRRLIWDPCDDFCTAPRLAPTLYWRRMYAALRFDAVLATSPACAATMRAALPACVAIHVVAHHCDSGLRPAWNANGPVAYAGLQRFIERKLPAIREACASLGRECRTGLSQSLLAGASCALCLRCPPHDTELNRRCKPQIKIENAAAAGLPIVTTDCPAALSLHPELAETAVAPDFRAEDLAAAITRAIARGPVSRPCTEADYLRAVRRVLGPEHLEEAG